MRFPVPTGLNLTTLRLATLRLAALALTALGLTALPARADVFDLATGTWGIIDYEPLSCGTNPHRISFSADRSRSDFVWEQLMLNYQGDWDLEGGYTVIAHGKDSITMKLDGESRLTDAGEPVVWILRLQKGGARYCWGRTDWPASQCIDRYIRCPAPVPLS